MLSRFAPFLILVAGAVGLYFLWSKIFGAAKPKTTEEVQADTLTAARNACLAKGGTWQNVTAGGIADAGASALSGNSCREPDLPAAQVPAYAYGGCPDRLSCAGQPSPVTHPPNVPTPPASQPNGTSALPGPYLFAPSTPYRGLGR